MSGAVPTVWNDVLGYLDKNPEKKPESLGLILCGGSAVPISLQRALSERHGIEIRQAWGMTETSPVASAGRPPLGVEGEDIWHYRGTQGRLLAGVEGRIVNDDGEVLPNDNEAVGELEVRGPWVTGSYYNSDDPEAGQKFHDGWLRTGDVGKLDELGYITLTDRAKDVIKSGGEWISTVDLENALMAHDDVVEAAVVAIPDEKWAERPLGHGRGARGRRGHPSGAARVPGQGLRQVAAARRLGIHRPGAAHERRQVRQEGAAQAVRRGRAGREALLVQVLEPVHAAVGVVLLHELLLEEGVDPDDAGETTDPGHLLQEVRVAGTHDLGHGMEAAPGPRHVDHVLVAHQGVHDRLHGAVDDDADHGHPRVAELDGVGHRDDADHAGCRERTDSLLDLALTQADRRGDGCVRRPGILLQDRDDPAIHLPDHSTPQV